MERPVKVACVQVQPVVLDREATLDKLETVAAEAAKEGAELVVFPETFVPGLSVVALGEGVRGLGGRGREGDVRAPRAGVGRRRLAGRAAHRRRRAGARDLDRDRRQRGRRRAARHDLQLAPLPLAGRRARAPPPQARADEPRAARLGTGRRPRPRGGRDRLRPDRRPDLLGELHAARARRALRVGRRDLRRVDRRRRRGWQQTLVHIARESRAYVVAPAHFQLESAYPDDFPLAAEIEGAGTIGRGGSAILAPDGSYLAGPLYDEEAILYAELDPARLLAERQRFDPVGHYSRPDVLQLTVRADGATTSTRPSAESARP